MSEAPYFQPDYLGQVLHQFTGNGEWLLHYTITQEDEYHNPVEVDEDHC